MYVLNYALAVVHINVKTIKDVPPFMYTELQQKTLLKYIYIHTFLVFSFLGSKVHYC